MTVKGLRILLEIANSNADAHEEIEAAVLTKAPHPLDEEQLAECILCVKMLRSLAYRGLIR